MKAYRLYTVVPRLVEFIEQLTNCYVRLNRNRLKGSEGAESARAGEKRTQQSGGGEHRTSHCVQMGGPGNVVRSVVRIYTCFGGRPHTPAYYWFEVFFSPHLFLVLDSLPVTKTSCQSTCFVAKGIYCQTLCRFTLSWLSCHGLSVNRVEIRSS